MLNFLNIRGDKRVDLKFFNIFFSKIEPPPSGGGGGVKFTEQMITLTQKKVKAKLLDKTNLRNKEALNKLKFNDDSPEEKFLVKIQVHKPQTSYSLIPKFLKNKKKKENQDIQREDIFEKAKDVTIISESACSSTFLPTRVFQNHYWIISSSGGFKEMVTSYLGHYVNLHFETIHFI